MAEQRRYVPEHMASIKVIGVGGGGCNAIPMRMVDFRHQWSGSSSR